MKKEIKKLELKKLFKEFGFLKIDEEYKKEVQDSYGRDFEKAVQDIFKENPDVNLLFNNGQSADYFSENTPTKQKRLDGIEIYNPNITATEHVENYVGFYTGSTNIQEEKISESKIEDDVKKLYRKIATKTHPDKVSNKYLNNLYLKAQEAYNKNDVFTLYLICNDLDIDYEFAGEKLSDFKIKIKNLRANNLHVEHTYLWAWIHEENEDIKLNILRHFITHSYKR